MAGEDAVSGSYDRFIKVLVEELEWRRLRYKEGYNFQDSYYLLFSPFKRVIRKIKSLIGISFLSNKEEKALSEYLDIQSRFMARFSKWYLMISQFRVSLAVFDTGVTYAKKRDPLFSRLYLRLKPVYFVVFAGLFLAAAAGLVSLPGCGAPPAGNDFDIPGISDQLPTYEPEHPSNPDIPALPEGFKMVASENTFSIMDLDNGNYPALIIDKKFKKQVRLALSHCEQEGEMIVDYNRYSIYGLP